MWTKRKVIAILSVGCWILALSFNEGCNRSDSSENLTSQSQDTVALTRSWEKPIPNQEVPEGLITIQAQECGKCHEDIYKEWQLSVHAVAFQDPQFQSEWKKDNVYVCLNCHTPLQNQQEFIVTGLIDGDHKNPVSMPNPQFDKILQEESITCATCHVRDGQVIGAQGLEGSPHAVKKDPDFLSIQLCLGCHNVSEELNPQLVCTFETGNEWMMTEKMEQGNNCISCHMPEVKRALSPFGKEYNSHFHNFPGSGIPKFADRPIAGLQGLEIFEDQIQGVFSLGDSLYYELKIKNSFAGHSLPTGDPERFYLVNLELKQEDKTISGIEFRIGERWEWFPEAKKISDNNLISLEERSFPFESVFTKTGKFELNVEITKHRITLENAEYNQLPEDYPRFISIFKRTYPIRVEN